jgi:hypothetical protein
VHFYDIINSENVGAGIPLRLTSESDKPIINIVPIVYNFKLIEPDQSRTMRADLNQYLHLSEFPEITNSFRLNNS